MNYKLKSFDDRLNESTKILKKYPDRIPIILQKYDNNAPHLEKYKYLVSSDTTFGSLLYSIRNNTKLKPSEAIFLSINGKMCSTSMLIKEIYETEKEKDNFLYISFSCENTFGDF